jgi:hypothetical protein
VFELFAIVKKIIDAGGQFLSLANRGRTHRPAWGGS